MSAAAWTTPALAPAWRPILPTRETSRRLVRTAALRDKTPGGTSPNGQTYDARFIASTQTLAADGGVILSTAWHLDNYQRRPVVVSQHRIDGQVQLSDAAIGRTVHIGIEDGLPVELCGPTGRALVAYVRFAPTREAQDIRGLYATGVLNDVSVRWAPETAIVRAPYADEMAMYGPGLSWVAERADLVEISCVLFGADGGAQQIRTDPIRSAIARARAATSHAWSRSIGRIARGPSGNQAAKSQAVSNTLATGYSSVGTGNVDQGYEYPHAVIGGNTCGRCMLICCKNCPGEDCDGNCCAICRAYSDGREIEIDLGELLGRGRPHRHRDGGH